MCGGIQRVCKEHSHPCIKALCMNDYTVLLGSRLQVLLPEALPLWLQVHGKDLNQTVDVHRTEHSRHTSL